jgi:hypothetical protein
MKNNSEIYYARLKFESHKFIKHVIKLNTIFYNLLKLNAYLLMKGQV